MNNVKKNNKGFSLVELIVVVLIMAIIAVSLAPQVMKWVNNSRIATDIQTGDSVVSAAQLALTNKDAYAKVTGLTKDTDNYKIIVYGPTSAGAAAKYEIKVTNNDSTTAATNSDEFVVAFCEAAGIEKKATEDNIVLKTTDATITVEISKAGKITRTNSAGLTSTDLQ